MKENPEKKVKKKNKLSHAYYDEPVIIIKVTFNHKYWVQFPDGEIPQNKKEEPKAFSSSYLKVIFKEKEVKIYFFEFNKLR